VRFPQGWWLYPKGPVLVKIILYTRQHLEIYMTGSTYFCILRPEIPLSDWYQHSACACACACGERSRGRPAEVDDSSTKGCRRPLAFPQGASQLTEMRLVEKPADGGNLSSMSRRPLLACLCSSRHMHMHMHMHCAGTSQREVSLASEYRNRCYQSYIFRDVDAYTE